MKTYLTPVNEIEKKWHHVNAEGKVLGRLATEIADCLRGKNKPTFCNFQDNGDFVVVTNRSEERRVGKEC